MWMGGHIPLGFEVQNRKLLIVPSEAETVRHIYQRFLECGSATLLVQELDAAGVKTKTGNFLDKGYLYRMLANRLYLGEIVIGEESVPGEHEAIIDREIWEKVHTLMTSNTRRQPRSFNRAAVRNASSWVVLQSFRQNIGCRTSPHDVSHWRTSSGSL